MLLKIGKLMLKKAWKKSFLRCAYLENQLYVNNHTNYEYNNYIYIYKLYSKAF